MGKRPLPSHPPFHEGALFTKKRPRPSTSLGREHIRAIREIPGTVTPKGRPGDPIGLDRVLIFGGRTTNTSCM
ncbi:hypothetical protein TRM7557_03665 [Tritonibacter multivorans]|uniref:Uncharacterized protein n=1 Tax=Tritonibacter multivorans TaxID=928856 RepID=A0A0P1GIP6_9RHOB|nr:hypothetical protein TRM7557_03665 [Tritonibacter multivorans]SFC91510.1 hypothetical protein SAMN04488049_1059 [Tritonibacter multivorans]